MISTHILDLSLGQPAPNVTVRLEKKSAGAWSLVEGAVTNSDGRINFHCPFEAGIYQLSFEIEKYFLQKNQSPFFTVAPVIFEITDVTRKYHIPLLLSEYGYSTYRGS